MIIEIKNWNETDLLKRLLYNAKYEICKLEEHARSHGEVYTHPDRAAVDGLISDIEATILGTRDNRL